MAAKFSFVQVSGMYPGQRKDIGSYGELISFKPSDDYGIVKQEITPGQFSYETWLQLRFTGDFYSIEDIVLFLMPTESVVPLPQVKMGCVEGYQTPIGTSSSIATTIVPGTWVGTPANVSVNGNTATLLTPETEYSDFIVLQALAPPTPGFVDQLRFGIHYVEKRLPPF